MCGNLAGDDELAGEAAEYLRLAGEGWDGFEKARVQFPLVAQAEAINNDPDRCNDLKLMILGYGPVEHITRQLGIEPDVIEKWKALFFDIQEDCNPSSGWLARHLVMPAYDAGHGDLAAMFQLSIVGGPAAVRLLLGGGDASELLDGATQLIGQRIQLDIAANRALSVLATGATGGRACVKGMKRYIGHLAAEKRLELAEQRLGEKCRRVQSRREFALAKAEAKRKRKERRETERQQKRLLAQGGDEDPIVLMREQVARQQRVANSPLAKIGWETGMSPTLDHLVTAPTLESMEVRPMSYYPTHIRSIGRKRRAKPVPLDPVQLLGQASRQEYEQRVVAERIAASPLAKLTWELPAEPQQREVQQPAPVQQANCRPTPLVELPVEPAMFGDEVEVPDGCLVGADG